MTKQHHKQELTIKKYPAQALALFKEYNAQKIDFLYEQLPMLKKIIYDVVPLLIHLFDWDEKTSGVPAGAIVGYTPTHRAINAYSKAFPGKTVTFGKKPIVSTMESPVKTVALIGSLGSVAQNSKSDFDYWICIDRSVLNDSQLETFRDKLQIVKNWAERFANAEVHFFLMDLKRIRQNDFGEAGAESSGSAMGNLLKEEFYRSMTLVAGQIPMWWAMPPSVSDQDYDRLAGQFKKDHRLDPNEIVDMGNLKPHSIGEFYGAAIWQISKTIGSPFKSVLKIALMEEYIMTQGANGYLADELKRRLVDFPNPEEILDSYLLMFDRAMLYLSQNNRHWDVELLRQCFYLKVREIIDTGMYHVKNLPRKKNTMTNLVKSWGWSAEELKRMNSYHEWSFEDSLQLSKRINLFIFRTFAQIKAEISRYQGEVNISIREKDLLVLNRKLQVFYSTKPNKVESIKSVIENPPVLAGVTIQRELNEQGQLVWGLYRGLLSREKILADPNDASRLKTSIHLAEAMIWLTHNRLFGPSTSINVNPGRSDFAANCSVADIHLLLTEMLSFFPQYVYRNLAEAELLNDSRLVRMILILNLNAPDRTEEILDIDICYQNNWGEVFYERFNDTRLGLELVRGFIRLHFDDYTDGKPDNFKVFLSRRHQSRAILPGLSLSIGSELNVI